MNYLELFSSSCREKPRLMALAQAMLRQVADLAACAAAIEPGYAAENAVGVQLDAAGESWKQEYVAKCRHEKNPRRGMDERIIFRDSLLTDSSTNWN